jgi:replicative DNA helicase|tara:strand:+ start:776 stop:2071 length:1296 start_codon:yes stop_codon:yes gene_type:complete
MTDKIMEVLPSSEEAEEALIGCILSGGLESFDRAASWIRDDNAFYYDKPHKVWNVMSNMYKIREPIEVVTVVNRCNEKYGRKGEYGYYLTGIDSDTISEANLEHYARIIWEKHVQRSCVESANDVLRMSYTDYNKTSKILEKHSRLIEELREIQPSRRREIDIIIEETAEALKEGTNIISFGIPALDAPAGGMTRKEVTVLGGRPGHGKTTLMLNVIRSLMEQNYRVMLFNREMSNVEMLKKLLVIESEVLVYDKVRKHLLTIKELAEIDSMKERVKKKYKNLMMYDDIRGLDESIREVMKHRPDVVIDDYIQLINVDGKDARRFEIEKIMYDYKWACKSANCSALLISQLNREIEKRDNPIPKMSDYAESGVIEQTAETALFVFYGWAVDRFEFEEDECMIVAAKSRYGQIGNHSVGFDGNKCRFFNKPD